MELKFDAIYKPTGEHFTPSRIDLLDKAVFGRFNNNEYDHCHYSFDGKYGDAILRISSGLKDRIGNEIFSGDTVRYGTEFTNPLTGKGRLKLEGDYPVIYSNGSFKVDFGKTQISLASLLKDKDVHTFEVIGNIFEDQILKEETK